METEKNICIVIPCYNEEKKLRLQLDEFNTFIKEYPDVLLCFVNDGSSDNTVKIIQEIKTKNEENSSHPPKIISKSKINRPPKPHKILLVFTSCIPLPKP